MFYGLYESGKIYPLPLRLALKSHTLNPILANLKIYIYCVMYYIDPLQEFA